MKAIYISLFSLGMLVNSYAIEIQILGPCFPTPLFIKNINKTNSTNIGEFTIQVLEKFEIPYKGTSAGINQIYNTPIGMDAMEVISDNEMMAYGWCYEVDGKLSEVLANEFPLNKTIKQIRWFYGYAHYLNGEWISQCEKSYLRRSPQFCSY